VKNFIKEWHGALTALGVVAGFCLFPTLLSGLHSTSGTIDWAYLQALAFSTFVFFSAILCSWIAIQCDWKIFTTYIKDRELHDDWLHLKPIQRILILKATIFLLIVAYILCFAFLPKP